MCTSRDSKAHDAREENWHERGHSGVICEESGQRESETERNKKKMVRFVSNTVFCNQCRRSMRRVRARIRANAINFATEFKCSVPMTTKETLFHFALFRYFLLRSFFHSFCELACLNVAWLLHWTNHYNAYEIHVALPLYTFIADLLVAARYPSIDIRQQRARRTQPNIQGRKWKWLFTENNNKNTNIVWNVIRNMKIDIKTRRESGIEKIEAQNPVRLLGSRH